MLDINPGTGVLSDITGSPFTEPDPVSLISISQDGEMLYSYDAASGRIRLFALDPTTGAPTEIDDSPVTAATDGIQFIEDPLGRFLYIGHQNPVNLVDGFEIIP